MSMLAFSPQIFTTWRPLPYRDCSSLIQLCITTLPPCFLYVVTPPPPAASLFKSIINTADTRFSTALSESPVHLNPGHPCLVFVFSTFPHCSDSGQVPGAAQGLSSQHTHVLPARVWDSQATEERFPWVFSMNRFHHFCLRSQRVDKDKSQMFRSYTHQLSVVLCTSSIGPSSSNPKWKPTSSHHEHPYVPTCTNWYFRL